MKLLLGKHELAYVNMTSENSTQIELMLPTFNIIEYLRLGLYCLAFEISVTVQ